MHAYFTFAVIAAGCHQLAVARKPLNMTVLHMIPFQLFGSSLKGSMDAAQTVVNLANARADLLPDYHITLDVQDEDALGGYVTGAMPLRKFLQFVNSFDNLKTTGTLPAPIVVGPFNSNACKAMAPVVPHLNMVQLASMCRSPILVNRQAYPNLFLTLSTNEILAKAQAVLFKQIGNWKRIGILAFAGLVTNFMTALYVDKYARLNGIEVAYLNAIYNDPDSSIVELLARDVRIISINIADTILLWKFYCRSYDLGLTGPKYVFIDDATLAADPYTMPNSACSGKQLAEQFKYVLWGSQALENLNKTWTSEFGYTPAELDSMMYITDANRSNYTYTHRAVVHDAVLRAVYGLHETDLELRKWHNLTLSNFTTHPELVMKVANSTLLRLSRAGIRGQMRYGASTYNEFDTMLFSQWTGAGLQTVLLSENVVVDGGQNIMIIRSTRGNFSWAAWNRNERPPNDRELLVRQIAEVPIAAFVVIAIFAGLGSVGCLIATLKSKSNRSPFFRAKTVGYFGCVLLNAAGVMFTLQKAWSPDAIAIIRIVFLVAGVTICSGILSFRNVITCLDLSGRAYLPGNVMRVSNSGRHSSINIFAVFDQGRNEAKTLHLTLGYVLLNMAITAGWLGGDSYRCSLVRLVEESFYNAAEDIYFERSTYLCESANQIAWIAALLVLNVAVLGFGLYKTYHLRKLARVTKEHVPEMDGTTLGIINAAALFVLFFLVVIILDSQVKQDVALAVGLVLMATSTMLSWFLPVFHRRQLHHEAT